MRLWAKLGVGAAQLPGPPANHGQRWAGAASARGWDPVNLCSALRAGGRGPGCRAARSQEVRGETEAGCLGLLLIPCWRARAEQPRLASGPAGCPPPPSKDWLLDLPLGIRLRSWGNHPWAWPIHALQDLGRWGPDGLSQLASHYLCQSGAAGRGSLGHPACAVAPRAAPGWGMVKGHNGSPEEPSVPRAQSHPTLSPNIPTQRLWPPPTADLGPRSNPRACVPWLPAREGPAVWKPASELSFPSPSNARIL